MADSMRDGHSRHMALEFSIHFQGADPMTMLNTGTQPARRSRAKALRWMLAAALLGIRPQTLAQEDDAKAILRAGSQ
jgi:hypothetical protein